MAAVEAKSDFLADAATVEAIAADLEDRDIDPVTEEEIATSLANALDASESAVENAPLTNVGGDFNDVAAIRATLDFSGSERVAEATITDLEEALAEDVADAQEAVDEVRGLSGRIDTLLNRKAQLESAVESVEEGRTELLAEMARVDTLDTGNELSGTLTIANEGTVGDRDAFEITDGTNTIIEFNAQGRLVVTADGRDVPGISALLAQANSYVNGLKSADTALANFDTAIARVVALESGETVEASDADEFYNLSANSDTGLPTLVDGMVQGLDLSLALDANSGATAPDSQNLIQAKVNSQVFTEALESYRALKELDGQLTELDEAIDDALEALEDAGFFVTVVDDSVDGTIEDDVFLYVENTDADNLEITNFSDEGSDVLYVGDAFAQLTRLEDEADLSAERLGSNDVREIFVQQDGNNTVLFIEAEAAAGGDRNLDEITTITLTGVNADDLVLQNGFISIVEAA